MKTQTIFLSVIFSFISLFAIAQKTTVDKSEEIKVWGNCGMCKSTIEKSAKTAGATYALWNEDTKMLKVKYPAAKTSGAKIQEKIAAAGYDTKDFTASDEAYNNLHECCKYDRKESAAVKHDKDCCKDKCTKDAKDCCSKAR